jgi:hypothetical protein
MKFALYFVDFSANRFVHYALSFRLLALRFTNMEFHELNIAISNYLKMLESEGYSENILNTTKWLIELFAKFCQKNGLKRINFATVSERRVDKVKDSALIRGDLGAACCQHRQVEAFKKKRKYIASRCR